MRPRSQHATPARILTGRKKTRFSHFRSSVLPLRNKTNFAVDTPANFSTPHTKFERTESLQAFPRYVTFKNWLSFFGFFFFLFSHTYKNCHKTRTPYPIALKFGTQRGYKGASWYQVWLNIFIISALMALPSSLISS